MRNALLTAVSAVAIIAAASAAHAADSASAQSGMEAKTETTVRTGGSADRNTGSNHNPGLATVPPLEGEDIERGLDNLGEAISDAADSVTTAAEDGYDNIRGALIDENAKIVEGDAVNYITIDGRHTAGGMIGKDVRNNTSEAIAKVEDIIFDKDGRAMQIVVANGGFMGLGEKKAAFSYDTVVRRDQNGDVIMPVSEEAVKQAAEFSYDRTKASEDVRVIPANGFSANKLLKAKVIDSNGNTVANVKNLALSGGAISRVIVGFDDVMGMGGQHAVLFFDQLALSQTDTTAEFRLSAAQTAQFARYKDAVTSSN